MVNNKSLDAVLNDLAGGPEANEALLLLGMLNLALTNPDVAATTQDKEKATASLMRAVDTYGGVKSLLPELSLLPEQVALVQERLDTVRRHLWTGPVKPVSDA
jgi:hypothetical protein